MKNLFKLENYVDQTTKDLHYNVFSGSAEEENFNVIKGAEYTTDIVKITALIIGESHCINIAIGPHSLTEVLAGVVPKANEIMASAVSDEIFTQDVSLKLEDISYRFTANKINLGISDEGLAAFEDFYAKALIQNRAIEHVFEMPMLYDYEAKTAIAIEELDDTVRIQTLHLYPNEGTGVVTSTRVYKGLPDEY